MDILAQYSGKEYYYIVMEAKLKFKTINNLETAINSAKLHEKIIEVMTPHNTFPKENYRDYRACPIQLMQNYIYTTNIIMKYII